MRLRGVYEGDGGFCWGGVGGVKTEKECGGGGGDDWSCASIGGWEGWGGGGERKQSQGKCRERLISSSSSEPLPPPLPSLSPSFPNPLHSTPLHSTSEVSVSHGPPEWLGGEWGGLSNSIFFFLFSFLSLLIFFSVARGRKDVGVFSFVGKFFLGFWKGEGRGGV